MKMSMTTSRQADPFGSPQPDLLDAALQPVQTPERMQGIVRPSPSLAALRAEARAATRMPWNRQVAEVDAVVFHNMADWLPEDGREAMRAAFRAECPRLPARA